jgi:predicted nucleic acid-binding protein
MSGRFVAVDTNILVYAQNESSPWHAPARRALESLANAAQPWAIPWPCVHEFLAIVTSPRIAALCIEHGVTELWTADRDFSRLPGLRAYNPLPAL